MATELHPYFSIIRSPDDIVEVLHWGLEQCRGKEDHEAPYALGILAAIQWLTDDSYPNPQDYLGPFTVENVLLQAKVAENIRNRSRADNEEEVTLLKSIDARLKELIDQNEERAREEARAQKLIDPPRWIKKQHNRTNTDDADFRFARWLEEEPQRPLKALIKKSQELQISIKELPAIVMATYHLCDIPLHTIADLIAQLPTEDRRFIWTTALQLVFRLAQAREEHPDSPQA